ncbi:non-hydrolyzing UDP-N-acetylglucosamine 2-epimerase [Nocardiopsis sp. CNT-189]|uniref:non-hydrolyzing UDP-N-acetylglucosamine 2-epimerase n=1 Tax=Nocardiopsis oceanisediminis TaxID=2816862 RepID=UPI003B3B900F
MTEISMPGYVAVVLGTRPEMIKLAPLVRELGERTRVIHTGQHWGQEMSGAFLEGLGMPEPVRLPGIGGHTRGRQIGVALDLMDEMFRAQRPTAVVVQGDTNSTVAGALAANSTGVPLVHVEAGLRSNDRNMPEEYNRIVTDNLADVLCAATELNRLNLLHEAMDPDMIEVTGNTVVEVVQDSLPGPERRERLLRRTGVRPDEYVLATIHRPENTDHPEQLSAILHELSDLVRTTGRPVLFPMHPRTGNAVTHDGLEHLLEGVTVVDPMGYADFLALARHAALIISDSGGIQEECTVLKRPLLVVRRSTERPEAVDAGFARLVRPGPELGVAARERLERTPELLASLAPLPSPYGDGTASARIAELVGGRVPVPAPAA